MQAQCRTAGHLVVGGEDGGEALPALQQAVDNFHEGLRGLVSRELLYILGGRRQAGKAVGGASNQGTPVCARRGRQTGGLELGEDEPVHGVNRRGLGWDRAGDGLESPEGAPLFERHA